MTITRKFAINQARVWLASAFKRDEPGHPFERIAIAAEWIWIAVVGWRQ